MNHSHKTKRLMKKAIAVLLGITMAFGALSLPYTAVKDSFITASAYTADANECTFYYDFSDRTDSLSIKITGVSFSGDTVEIPSVITHEGAEYPVTDIGQGFLKDNKQIKTIIFPDSVNYICQEVLMSSSVEKIVLGDHLVHVGDMFASGCDDLTTVVCNSTDMSLYDMGDLLFYNCGKLRNSHGCVSLGNWLIRYYAPSNDKREIKIADLGEGDIKLDSIASSAIWSNSRITAVDLEGIKNIGRNNFTGMTNLESVTNTESVNSIKGFPFKGSPWYNKAINSDFAKLGSVLLYYKTDDTVIDLTSGSKLAGITTVGEEALADCKNLDTIICNSDCIFLNNALYHEKEVNPFDILPIVPYYNIKTVYIDGKELTIDLLESDLKAAEWIRHNAYYMNGSVFMNKLVEEKTKQLFKQMDIPYYGISNDKMGTHTPTEEFYIRLKIHNYLSAYDYDHETEYGNETDAFLLGGKLDCLTYATLTHYLLECAGVEAKTYYGSSHYYNSTKIGGEWFENDDGWDAQNNNHAFGWFGLSTKRMYDQDTSEDPKIHGFTKGYDSFHEVPFGEESDMHAISKRTIGDVDSDTDRDQDDVDTLWNYIKTNSTNIDNIEKTGDVNFDGKADVTDAVLLDQFVNSKALDMNNVPKDGYAPTVKVAFLNGKDYDNIKYLFTDREGYITLPSDLFEVPDGMKLKYDKGNPGQKIRVTDPCTVINTNWVDKNTPDFIPGDVNGDGTIDIEDAVMIINHVNGQKAMTDDEVKRADIDANSDIDIEDAVAVISHVNGVKSLYT